jgi:2-oxoglutarate dehydrogenase E2 component (dihydrolipoamide succinyltransferase)
MAKDVVVPALGESITEGTIAKWMKHVGDDVARDEALLELETDKVTLEVFAPAAGKLAEITAEEGATVEVGAVVGRIAEKGEAAEAGETLEVRKPASDTDKKPAAAAPAAKQAPAKPELVRDVSDEMRAQAKATMGDRREAGAAPEAERGTTPAASAAAGSLSPSVRKLMEENSVAPSEIAGSGPDGRITKGDVLDYIGREVKKGAGEAATAPRPQPAPAPAAAPAPAPAPKPAARPAAPTEPGAREERVRMTRLRKRIAERLKQAQDNAAMLTTFNEADLSAVIAARKQYREIFEKKHGVKLGFMSFFVKACIVALKEIPAVNAEIDGDDIVYKNYYDIGVAVGTEQGLVVPVLRGADQMSFAEIETRLSELGRKAREGKLAIDDLTGGTFTISNGGVYGSLMSTPILNPPQSGILGMHKIEDRPIAVAGKLEIRPMMYLALSYDHRIIDGREAVTFLVRIKECIEDPQRILLDM